MSTTRLRTFLRSIATIKYLFVLVLLVFSSTTFAETAKCGPPDCKELPPLVITPGNGVPVFGGPLIPVPAPGFINPIRGPGAIGGVGGGADTNSPPPTDNNGSNGDCDSKNPTTTNPVIISTGNKIKEETDFVVQGQHPFGLVRHYNKDAAYAGSFGNRWTSNFDYKLGFRYSDNSYCTPVPSFTPSCAAPAGTTVTAVTLYRPDGSQFSLTYNTKYNNAWHWTDVKPVPIAYMDQVSGNWVLHNEARGIETYDSGGRLVSLVDKYGIGWTPTYDFNYHLQQAVDTAGRSVTFTWSSNLITAVTDPAGKTYTYSYSFPSILTQVAYPDSLGSRTYLYEDAAHPYYWLTGIQVNGRRYSTYAYGTDGKTAESGLAGGTEKLTFQYGANYTIVTNARGAQSQYTYEPDINGSNRLVRIDRSGITNCPNAAAQTVYDANGYVDYELDWDGNKTEVAPQNWTVG